MTDELKLSLDRGGKESKGQKGLYMVLVLILVSTVAVLALMVMDRTGQGPDHGGLSVDKLETLALKLERQQLYGAAARAWTEYIGKSSPGDAEAAAVWFRTGKLYQEGGD
ncbi:MAG TPA: hypothetical protein VLA34_03865, partial [Candidatus Krumholzibacterium sp.]|nr:hypothetical protein [Candidatus Krumholzibacterium sp.]